MEITQKIRNEQLIKSSKKQYFLFSSSYSGKTLFETAQKYNLHKDETYKKFAITVGDIILGFYKIEDTVPLLRQELGVDDATAERLGADVLEFLAPLSDPNWQPPLEEGVDEENDADMSTPSAIPDVSEETEEATFVPIRSSLATSPIESEGEHTEHTLKEPHQPVTNADDSRSTFSSMIPAYEPVPPRPGAPVSTNSAIPIISAPVVRNNPPSTVTPPPQSANPAPVSSTPSPFDSPRPVPPPPPGSSNSSPESETVYRSTQPTRAVLSEIPSYQENPSDTPPTPHDPPRWSTG